MLSMKWKVRFLYGRMGLIQDQVAWHEMAERTSRHWAVGTGLGCKWAHWRQRPVFYLRCLEITVLLCVLIFAISYIQSYFPPERSKRILGRFHGIWANIISALLGTVTPFCSCSSIPLFIGFTSAGLPLGVSFSFLISSPMVDLGSLVLLMSIFGAKVAIVYVILGLVIAVIGGTMIEKLHMESTLKFCAFGWQR